MTLGALVKKYRDDNNLSMDEFSKRSSLSKGYISMIENGINPRNNKPIAPTLPSLQKLAHGMNIELDDLLKMIDGKHPVSLVTTDSPKKKENTDTLSDNNSIPYTIAAHLEGKDISDDEAEDIMKFIDFVISKRNTPE